jgi:hypothetical protein
MGCMAMVGIAALVSLGSAAGNAIGGPPGAFVGGFIVLILAMKWWAHHAEQQPWAV